MNLSDPNRTLIVPRSLAQPEESSPAWEDPRLLPAVQEYLAELEAGRKPNRQEFLARHPEIASELAECLDGLTFVHSAAGQMPRPTEPAAEVDSLLQSPLGDFRIVREVGRGGMGVVYEAVQLSLGRRVALKVLPFASALDAKRLRRFQNEAQAAAHLHHPNIVPVYFVGCERGVHFYAMQLVEGQTLAVLIGQLRRLTGRDQADDPEGITGLASEVVLRSLSPPRSGGESAEPPAGPAATTVVQAAEATSPAGRRPWRGAGFFRTAAHLGVQAAEALEHAHQLGVVHRDIKPGNLLIDGRGNLWVTDFGLAHFPTDAALTRTGDVVGTLRYMSPEQALGKTAVLDHRTDVFSLGATLYELLTLEPAFDGRSPHELLDRISAAEPRPLRAVDRSVPVELETIVLKALAKEPAERYATAQELADDLRRFLNDQPIRARRPGVWERARKWCRRHRGVTIAAMLLLLLTATGSSVTALLLAQEQAETRAAYEREQKARRVSERDRERAEWNLLQARDTVDFFTELCETELADRPQLADLRRQVLEASLTYYQGLIKEGQDDPETKAELAAARQRVADILSELSAVRAFGWVSHLVALMREPAVRDELGLSASQARAVLLLGEGRRRLSGAPSPELAQLSPEEKRQRLEQRTRTEEEALADLLSLSQARRLVQIGLQRQGAEAFRDPGVTAALALTREQQAAIRKLHERWRPPPPPAGGRRPMNFGPPPWKWGEGARKNTREEMVKILTDEQRAHWAEMTGEPFRADPRHPFRKGSGPRPGLRGPKGR
jgi:serine/threonine protein kinase